MGSTPARSGKLKTYLQLGRVSNLPTVWTNVLAGLVLAGGQVTASHFLILALSLSCSYVGGMFLNDAFDREHDRRFRPERPIPSGAASAQEVLSIGFGLLASGFLALLSFVHEGGWQLVAAGVMLALLILFYDLHHKQNPWSLLVMAGCRAMIYVIAAFTLAPILSASLFLGIAALFSYIVGLSALALHEADQRPGPLWPFALILGPFVGVMPTMSFSIGIALLSALLVSWMGYSAWCTVRGTVPQVRSAIGLWIAGISLLDAWLIASQEPKGLALLAIFGYVTTMTLQRWVKGT